MKGARVGTGIVWHPSNEIEAIQRLLADAYTDGGDGSTIVRELVQNADDAQATDLEFVVLASGLAGAANSLLRGPALLIANNGPYSKRDDDAMHSAIGGSKRDDATKIGTFGVGLKSVFHVCEAFAYIGAKESERIENVLNPWTGTGEGRNDPIHPDWNDLVGDRQALIETAEQLLDGLTNGLLLWLPLRQREHLDRGGAEGLHGLKNRCVTPADVRAWFKENHATSAVMLLAQCRHLRRIRATCADSPAEISDRQPMSCAHRLQGSEVWLDRPERDDPRPVRRFSGTVVANDSQWTVVGAEAIGSKQLQALKKREDWPKYSDWQEGRQRLVSRKGVAHGAVTILAPVGRTTEQLGLRLRWAAFLPLNDAPDPGQEASKSRIVESFGSSHAWQVILHGYYWPSQDRRSLPGVTSEPTDEIRDAWNKTLQDELVLPLLPSVLEQAVANEEQAAATGLIEQIFESRIVKDGHAAVCRLHWLLPRAKADGISYVACTPNTRVVSLPDWMGAPEELRQAIATSWAHNEPASGADIMVIDESAPRLAGQVGAWPIGLLEKLLTSIPKRAFRSGSSLGWVATFIHHVLPATGGESLIETVCNYLARVVGDGALAAATDDRRPDREALQDAWRGLCDALPSESLVPVPSEALQAIRVVAENGVFGMGLFPAPFRVPGDNLQTAPDQRRVDQALEILGTRLTQSDLSSNARHAHLRLAEALFTVRAPDRPLCGLESLPLVRATSVPAEEEVACSILDLRDQIDCGRAFSGGRSDGSRHHDVADPKRAATDLAEALGVDVCVVSRETTVCETPAPTSAALAGAAGRASAFAPAGKRKPLLERLVRQAEDDSVRVAVRALLVGRPIVEESQHGDIYYARSEREQRLLDIVIRVEGGYASVVEPALTALVPRLPNEVSEALSLRCADDDGLRALLRNAPSNAEEWTRLDNDEALHLLRSLPNETSQDDDLWKALPIHLCADGTRTAIDEWAYRVSETKSAPAVPRTLEVKLRRLQPEPEVAHRYGSVPSLNEAAILRLMLNDEAPQQFADEIVACLRPAGGDVQFPNDKQLYGALRQRPWLPLADGGGVPPDHLLVAPEDLLPAFSELGRADAFSGRSLPMDLRDSFWQVAKPVIRRLLGSLTQLRQLERICEALDGTVAVKAHGGAFALLPAPRMVDAALVRDVRDTALVRKHKGWGLIGAIASQLGTRDDVEDVLVRLARKLCGHVPKSEHQIDVLRTVSDQRPSKESPGGRAFERLLTAFAATDAFFADVLPHLDLPTQDGNWHATNGVARSKTGVAKMHLVLDNLRSVLRLDDKTPIGAMVTTARGAEESRTEGDILRNYFERWRGRVPDSEVARFLVLLGPGPYRRTERLAKEWLGDNTTFSSVWHQLTQDESKHNPSTVVSHVVEDNRVMAVNVLGMNVAMNAAPTDGLFAIDPAPQPPSRSNPALAPLGEFWEIQLRDVQAEQKTSDELLELLGNTAKSWAVHQLEIDDQSVETWWSKGGSSVADIGPVRASILAHLPLTLRQLDVNSCEALRKALSEAERAQREREQTKTPAATARESEALNKLADLVEHNPDHQEFVWHRVQEAMRRYGYDARSVLLELAQNADDALVEAAEINGRTLPPDARRLLVEVVQQADATTLDVTHFGRPINDTGGAAFPAGKERDWDQDLYFMMLMNLSGKPGENIHDGAQYATTGRFGLGFKSVHLISQRPSVVSGFISFSIAAGLLPKEESLPAEGELPMEAGRRCTRVRLPLPRDANAQELLAQVFEGFKHCRWLLPVFARQLCEVVVRKGGETRHRFEGKTIADAPGWSIGEVSAPSTNTTSRVLRFKPGEVESAGHGRSPGTLALAVRIVGGRPTSLDSEVPFLWNVVPTSESWGCGYAVNGPFKLDPGRTHVSLDDKETLRAAAFLGDALGPGLVSLHDTGGPPEAADDFLPALWRVLASGMGTEDGKRRAFLQKLHGDGRGLSYWTQERSVVPTGMYAPFPATLPPLTKGIRVEVASDRLDHRWCEAIAEIALADKDMAALTSERLVVSRDIERLLWPLLVELDAETPELLPWTVIKDLVRRWHKCLTPARLCALTPLANHDLLRYDNHGLGSQMVARAATGERRPLQQLLLSGASSVVQSDSSFADETLRSAFAPGNYVLHTDYIATNADLSVFQWLRERHVTDADTMSKWISDLSPEKHAAAANYLVVGELKDQVLERFIDPTNRPTWLADYDSVTALLESLNCDDWRKRGLLSALFPDRFGPKVTQADQHPDEDRTRADADAFFERLRTWWSDAQTRQDVIRHHETATWPAWLRQEGLAEGLRQNSRSHWLALLVLGACQSLGRTRDEQHRGFLQLAKEKGWWSVFTETSDDSAWMELLRQWQDEAVERLEYRLWLSLFPSIYQLSRHLDSYRVLLTGIDRRPDHLYSARRILAPRDDPALSGAGAQFDSPPLPLGIGFHWVVRELARLSVLQADHVFRDCYVPARRVLDLLSPLGLRVEDGLDAGEKSKAIYDFLEEHQMIDSNNPHFHLSFDVPLRHIAEDENLRRAWTDHFGRYRTKRGEWVRSKSEMAIADLLLENGADYQYEKALEAADGSRKRPDFTVVHEGREWYWEHWGMMDDEGYAQNQREKKKWYELHFNGLLEETVEAPTLRADAEDIIRRRIGKECR